MPKIHYSEAEITAALLALKKRRGGFNWAVPYQPSPMRKVLISRGLIEPKKVGRSIYYLLTDDGLKRLINVPGSGITKVEDNG